MNENILIFKHPVIIFFTACYLSLPAFCESREEEGLNSALKRAREQIDNNKERDEKKYAEIKLFAEGILQKDPAHIMIIP
ncbi:MAG: hypothetical protein V1752_04340 [Candidatus Firestonebacteria bacterium]